MKRELVMFILAACASGSTLAQNRVLDLDGKNSYVELPSNIFNTLDEATIETWVRWRAIEGWATRCFSYGMVNHDLGVEAQADKALFY